MLIEIVIVVAVVLTSMLSGVLGMAGGILLMVLLVSLKSIAAAMIIHGVVQGTANGSRAWLLRRHLAWKILPPYLVGAAVSFGAFASVAFLPNVHWVMIAIGSLPWVALVVPKLNGLDVTHPTTAVVCGTSGNGGATVRWCIRPAARLLLPARTPRPISGRREQGTNADDRPSAQADLLRRCRGCER